MIKLTRAEYDTMTPKQQGYVSYMQAAWNPEIPSECAHPEGSEARKQFDEGTFEAMLEAQDSED